MDTGILSTVGKIAGIGGLALGVLLLIFKDVIRKNIFPNLSQTQAFRIIRLILVLTFLTAIAGIFAWVFVSVRPDRANETFEKRTEKSSRDDGPGLQKRLVIVSGILPIHLWEKHQGPEKVTFTDHQLGFILKVKNDTSSSVQVNVVVLDGCVPVPLHASREMLINGEMLPKPLIMNKAYAELQKTTIQRIRVSGNIRPDSREVPALGVAHVGVLFPLPSGRSGALIAVPETVTTTGKCEAIKR
jgi:hypothetical protein